MPESAPRSGLALCTVESVRVHVLTGQHVVLLQPKDSDRLVPIWIGADQAHSIATRIAGIPSDRPLTHDLMMSMLGATGAEITRVVVKDLVTDSSGQGSVFHGSVFLQVGEREVEVDSRAWKQPASESTQADWIDEFVPLLLAKPTVVAVFCSATA